MLDETKPLETAVTEKPKKRSKAKTQRRTKVTGRESNFVKLRSMKCFDEVMKRLKDGLPLRELAAYIQDDCEEYTHVKRDSLLTILQEFRVTIPKAQLISKRLAPVFHKAADRVRKGVDEIEELEKLYAMQMGRIEIDSKNEKNIRKLLPTMPTEMKVATEILKTIAQLKMDLGLTTRHLGKVEVDARVLSEVQERYTNPTLMQVLSNPESRQRLLSIADQFRSLTARTVEADDAEVLEDRPATEDDSGIAVAKTEPAP